MDTREHVALQPHPLPRLRRWWVGYQNCALPCQDTNTDDVPGECGTNLVNLSVNRCSSVLQTEQYYNCGEPQPHWDKRGFHL